MVEFVGLSGPVKFDTSGLRTQFQLDLMELHMDGLVMMMIIVTMRKMISMKVKILTTFAADRQLLTQVITIFFLFQTKVGNWNYLDKLALSRYEGQFDKKSQVYMYLYRGVQSSNIVSFCVKKTHISALVSSLVS